MNIVTVRAKIRPGLTVERHYFFDHPEPLQRFINYAEAANWVIVRNMPVEIMSADQAHADMRAAML